MSRKPPPTGRVERLLRLAEAGARSGGALLYRRGADEGAKRVAEVLGNLRGLGAKVGQMASYVDGFLPEAQRDAFQGALSALQSGADASPPELVRELVEQELGAPIKQLFASWELEPFASASIGQVHAATLPDGDEVAVKVQHPGIAQAVESDLANVNVLQALVSRLAPRAVNAREIYEVVRQRFREELDYRLEARQVSFFRELHAGDSSIRVPAVIESHSAHRVLTTERVRGSSLEQAAQGRVESRRAYAETLWRFVFKGNLVGGRFNADPHPGNYVFHADGCVSFLDFGCVQVLDPEHIAEARGLHRAALEQSEAEFRRHAARLLGTRGGSYERAALDYSRRCLEPLFASPFRVTRAYVAELADCIMELKRLIWAKDKSFVQLPAKMIFLNRLQFGFYSVLAQLDVSVDYAAVEREFLR